MASDTRISQAGHTLGLSPRFRPERQRRVTNAIPVLVSRSHHARSVDDVQHHRASFHVDGGVISALDRRLITARGHQL